MFRTAFFSFLHDSSGFCFGSLHYSSPGADINKLCSSSISPFCLSTSPIICLVLDGSIWAHQEHNFFLSPGAFPSLSTTISIPNYRTAISQQMGNGEPGLKQGSCACWKAGSEAQRLKYWSPILSITECSNIRKLLI